MLHWPCFRRRSVLLKSAPAPIAVLSIAVFSNKRSRTNRGVEVAIPCYSGAKATNCRIESAGGEAKKGVLPFCCVASGIATIRRRNDCFCDRLKRKRSERQRNGGE